MNRVYEHDTEAPEGMITMTDRLRRALRRFDDWTLVAFNPPLFRRHSPRDGR